MVNHKGGGSPSHIKKLMITRKNIITKRLLKKKAKEAIELKEYKDIGERETKELKMKLSTK